MVIVFLRAGKQVKLDVRPNGKPEDSYGFCMGNQSREIEAQLIANGFRKMLEESLETIRRNAYELGYRDAKAKRRRMKTFYGDWDTSSERRGTGAR